MVLITIFAWVASGVVNKRLEKMDDALYSAISYYRGSEMTKAMIFISFLGGSFFLIVISLISFYILRKIKKHYWDSSFVVFNLLGAWLLNALLKSIYQRERPTLEHLAKVTGYSFPSGHSMVGFAFYGFMAYMIYLNTRDIKFRYPIMFTLILLAFSIGISRIYLGVHYASDVLGGFVGGGAWIGTCIAAHQSIRFYKSKI